MYATLVCPRKAIAARQCLDVPKPGTSLPPATELAGLLAWECWRVQEPGAVPV